MDAAPSEQTVETVSAMIVAGADLLWRHLVDREELSASATLVLNRLTRQGPMRLTALAEAEGASQSGMTQLVQRLERQGLLARGADPDDGRASLVMLSDQGRRWRTGREQLRNRRIAELMSGLSPEDQTTLWLAAQVARRSLEQMREIADAAAHAGPASQSSPDASSDGRTVDERRDDGVGR
jgi:DNA-binding MarR family transcriptional regulator